MNKPGIILLLSVFILTGCGTTLKQQWYDFNAYYNTFYNANQYFEEGLSENRRVVSDINPNNLIRIHPPPTSAGAEQFEQAIEKSSDILRRHSRSRYVDDAIELIGISWFYRQEYFAAQEKFQELYNSTSDPKKKAAAIIWEGRTYIELELYNEGVRFMEAMIEEHQPWQPSDLAEARAVLSQLYTFQENLFLAGNHLLMALDDFEGDELRPRAWFHYGQIMERIGNLNQAEYVFQEIGNMRTGFDLEYHAKLKEADIYRQKGELEKASDRLQAMSRDDKYLEKRPELLYEIGKTEHQKGHLEEAREYFNQVSRLPSTDPSPELVARTYYGLAELYRTGFGDYETAASWYESAAEVPVDREQLPLEWDADEMSAAFGEYARVRRQIDRMDSLLTLGRLPEEAFEERIREIEERLLEEREEEMRQRELMAIDVEELVSEELETTTEEVDRYGFMNINDPARLNQSSLQFMMLWNQRPLADDWRRRASFADERQDIEEQEVIVDPEEIITEEMEEGAPESGLQMDLSEIPFDEAEQDSLEAEIYRSLYRLGIIYLMNLNMPDSASVFFERVYREGPEEAPKEAALYALADVSLQAENEEEALRWAHKLIEEHPGSRHARQIAERMGLDPPEEGRQ